MSIGTQSRLQGKTRESYLELVRKFPLVSIKSEKQFKQAQRLIDGLFANGTLDHGAEAYVDALSDLMATYEDAHHSIEPASDADMLRHLMESKGVTQTELCGETEISKSTISEILSGRRPFSRHIIRSLAKYFGIDISVLAGNI